MGRAELAQFEAGQAVKIVDPYLGIETRVGIGHKRERVTREPVTKNGTPRKNAGPALVETITRPEFYLSVPLENLPARILEIRPLKPSHWITLEFEFQLQPESETAGPMSRRVAVDPSQIAPISEDEYQALLFNVAFPYGTVKA